ncbi:MAG: hypothetical protein HYU66_15695 [Armatimonadetes bacterium]|nr:hypothetical protein [Armatimonadota bacterium]
MEHREHRHLRAHPRPPHAAAHYLEPFVREHLLYGLWPGGYFTTDSPDYLALMRRVVPLVRRECELGWEPITFARADRQEVQVERFGGEGRPLLFSLKNGGKESVSAVVTVDATAFGPHPIPLPGGEGAGEVVKELYAGQPLEVVAGPPLSCSLELAAGQVYVVAVGTGGGDR